jgi:hypothetical protein
LIWQKANGMAKGKEAQRLKHAYNLYKFSFVKYSAPNIFIPVQNTIPHSLKYSVRSTSLSPASATTL